VVSFHMYIIHVNQLTPAEVSSLTLRTMWLYFHQSNSFISCYFGSRSVLSYLDLESELVEVLRSFMIPSVSIFISTQQPEQTKQNQDPNEINVDDPDLIHFNDFKSTPDVVSSFNDFGIGPLYLHPSVRSYFPELARDGRTELFVTSSDILGRLALSESDLSSLSIEDLESCLCEDFGTSSLRNIGIIVAGNLKLEIVMLRHVHAARVRILTEVQRGLLEEYAIQERNMKGITQSGTQLTRQRKDISKGNLLNISADPANLSITSLGDHRSASDSMKNIEITICSIESSRQGVSSFVDQCSSLLSGSPYSPSFSKVLDAVERVCREHEKDDKIARSNLKKRPRSRKRPESTDITAWEANEGEKEGGEEEEEVISREASSFTSTSLATLKEMAAEYIMLHLGGDKYRSKRIRATACLGADVASVSLPVSLPVSPPVSPRPEHDELITEGCVSSAAQGLIPDSVPGLCGITIDSAPILAPGRVANYASMDHGPATSTPSANTVDETCVHSESLLDRQMQSDIILAPPCDNMPTAPVTFFECKLSSHANVQHPIGRQRQQGSSVYVVSNETLRDLAPWCGVGSWTLKSVGALETVDLKAVGRWGEALVYQYLLQQSSSSSSSGLGTGTGTGAGLKGLNRESSQSAVGAAAAVEWVNSAEETKAVYDLITRESKSVVNTGIGASGRPTSITETTYIEVKTTRFDDLNTFEISLWEWQFATANPKVRYHIYRVYNAGDLKKVRIVVIEDILEMIAARRVRLCLSIR
jgi:Domain of unknown function (DUF3883)